MTIAVEIHLSDNLAIQLTADEARLVHCAFVREGGTQSVSTPNQRQEPTPAVTIQLQIQKNFGFTDSDDDMDGTAR